MTQSLKHYFLCGAAALVAAWCAKCGVGCANSGLVDETYAAELQACVDNAKTADEANACRRAVDEKYGVCQADDGTLYPCGGK